jgi:excisionase family DNA binding protein
LKIAEMNDLVDTARLLYDRKGAAAQLSVSVRTLDYLIADRRLSTRRVGKKVMIPRSELVRFARADHFSRVSREHSDE